MRWPFRGNFRTRVAVQFLDGASSGCERPYGFIFAMTRELRVCPRTGADILQHDAHVRALGSIDQRVEPVGVLAEKTRMAFQLRMSFAAFRPAGWA
jgi:hypothetical protein